MLSTADDAKYHFRPPMKQKKLNSTAQPLAFSVGTFNLLGQKHSNKKGRISRFTLHSIGHHFKICKKNHVELTNKAYRLTIEGLRVGLTWRLNHAFNS